MAFADRPTLFINATVLDGSEHMEPQPDMAVTVERGIITWIGPSAVAQALQVPRSSIWQGRISCQPHQYACAFVRLGQAGFGGRCGRADEEAR